jgi:hypothetical protein
VRGSSLLIACSVLVAAGCGRVSDDDAPVDARVDAPVDTFADASDAGVAHDDAPAESRDDAAMDTPFDAPALPASLDFAPVCGEDGVTYWNDEQAAAKGVSSTSGACRGVKPCGPGSLTPCPAGSVCIGDYTAVTPTYCTMTGDWSGDCWSIPSGAKCPTTDARSFFDCATSTCATFCELVRGVRSYRLDPACP